MVNNDSESEREVGHYEDLRSHANRVIWTIVFQIRRLQEMENVEFPLQYVSDTEFLILSLYRLYGIARQIDKMANSNGTAIRSALNKFEDVFPNLQEARNVISHVDEYLCGKGRNASVSVGSLSSHVFDPSRIRFADYEFDLECGFTVAKELYNAIRANPPQSYRQAVRMYQGKNHGYDDEEG